MSRLNPFIQSEINPLTYLLLAKPAACLQHLKKHNYKQYLFDGLPDLDIIFEEYENFIQLLKNNDVRPIFVDDLLSETLGFFDARQWIINRLFPIQYQDKTILFVRDFLLDLDPLLLAKYLINGVKFSEISARKTIQRKNVEDFLLCPLPNHYFTRDASIWLHEGVILGSMKSPIRRRETLIMSCIYRYSKKFNDQSACKIWFDNGQLNHPGVFLEGGDFMLLDKHTLLLGQSLRTNCHAINMLTKTLFEQTAIKTIVILELPKHPNCIHLDTILSMLNEHTFSLSKTLIQQIQSVKEISLCADNTKISIKTHQNLLGFLQKHLNNDINFIALDDKNIECTEQRYFANNLLTLRSGVVMSYEHNYHTNRLLAQAGIQVITLKSSQLHLGNGGVHCMSCPIVREQ